MAINVFIKGGGAQLSEISATADKVLSGYTYNDSDGEAQTGTMPNKGTININVSVNGEYTNTGGYYSSIKITGPTLSGDAEASNVLVNKTFYSNSGTKQTGTMENKGAITCSLNYGNTYENTGGYYSSIKITAPSRYGNATSADVLAGKTFMNSTTNSTGTMVNRGALAQTFNNWNGTKQYKTTNAGYYSSITVNCTWTVYTKTQEINGYYCNTGVTATGYYGISTTYSTANSIKIFTSAGYVWMTRNAGSGSATARIVKIWN